MSINRKYITRGIQNEINMLTTMFLWTLVEEIIQTNKEYDYLQVFELKVSDDKQIIIHKQEVPKYKKQHELNIEEHYIGKIFVIEGEDQNIKYWTMMLAHEY